MKKHLITIIILGFLVCVIYVVYLNDRVNVTFSKPIPQQTNIARINHSLENHSKELLNMLLLVEDRSYYQHWGVDFKEIGRVISAYVFDDKPLRGASTITQQLVKNTLLTREQSITRKIDEAIMALLMELSFDKNFILERYLNTVYLAQDGVVAVHGFASASEHYFDKSLEKLNLEQMATLVALLKGPSYYNPQRHGDRLKKRTELILSLHHKLKKII